MVAFLQTYGGVILVAVFFLLMVRRHRGHAGGGCGMGHSGSAHAEHAAAQGPDPATRSGGGPPAVAGEAGVQTSTAASHRHHGC